MKLRSVVQNELYAFRRALSDKISYVPYRHSWAHSDKMNPFAEIIFRNGF